MKRFAVLLAILLLAGCAARPSASGKESLSMATTEPEPTGFYEACSTAEAESGGALRCYPLQGRSCTGLMAVQDGLFLFTEEVNGTLIAKLTGMDAVPTAQLSLPFSLDCEDASFHLWQDGFSCYDPGSGDIITVNGQLEICARIGAPKDLMGKPILSEDGETLYYCTNSAVRALDLTSGISRLLCRLEYPHQTVSGLLLQDSVVQCTILEGSREETLFLCARTGTILQRLDGSSQVADCDGRCYAAIQENGSVSLLFGSKSGGPQSLILPHAGATGFFLPQQHGAIGVHTESNGAAALDYFDLTTGQRTASLCSEILSVPSRFTSAFSGGIWFLGYARGYEGSVLFYWETGKSHIEDPRCYTSTYHAPHTPDIQGLEACMQQARELGSRYGIEIRVQPEGGSVPGNYRLTYEHQVGVVQRELEWLEQALGAYPEEILQALSSRFEGLTICLVRSFDDSMANSSPDSVCSALFWDGYHPYIALAYGPDSPRALNHALCHLMDTLVLNESSLYDTWNELNPTGFSYDCDYAANLQRNSTAYLMDSNRYFTDMYAMSFPIEDRARILEYAMEPGSGILFQSDPMQSKLLRLCQGIRETFDLEGREAFLWEQHLRKPLA